MQAKIFSNLVTKGLCLCGLTWYKRYSIASVQCLCLAPPVLVLCYNIPTVPIIHQRLFSLAYQSQLK